MLPLLAVRSCSKFSASTHTNSTIHGEWITIICKEECTLTSHLRNPILNLWPSSLTLAKNGGKRKQRTKYLDLHKIEEPNSSTYSLTSIGQENDISITNYPWKTMNLVLKWLCSLTTQLDPMFCNSSYPATYPTSKFIYPPIEYPPRPTIV